MNVNDFLAATGMTLHALAMAARVSYTTLHPHAKRGRALSVATARKLESWSDGRMSAIDILGLRPPAPSPSPSTVPGTEAA